MKENQLIQLVEEMTIDEKINQLLQLAAAFYSDKAEEKTGPMGDLGLPYVRARTKSRND